MIRAKEIRVVGETGEQLGIMSVRSALDIANEQNLDLVEISPNANPPVCKIMNYGKFKYEKTKKDKEHKKKQKSLVIKEIRIKPYIDVADKETKINQILSFLEKDYKVKVSLRLSGREKLHADVAVKVLDEIAERLEEKAQVEKKYGKEQLQKFIMISNKKQPKEEKMSKMKSHKGTKKRIKITGTGKVVIRHSGKSHILTKKTHKRKKRLGQDYVVTGKVAKRVKRLLAGAEGR